MIKNEKQTNVVFRVDASNVIGSGHVSRCLTLANYLRKSGANCCFVCRPHTGNLIELIKSHNHHVASLPNPQFLHNAPDQYLAKNNYESWLGGNWEADADSTLNAVSKYNASIVIVDHYGIDQKWQATIRPFTKKIMVIDDLADRKHDCDILLDQNLVENHTSRYEKLIPPHCKSLLGPEYALLQPEYANNCTSPNSPNKPKSKILVYYGATDRFGLYEKTIDAILESQFNKNQICVVLNSQIPSYRNIESITKRHSNINIISSAPSLCSLMKESQLAIGACGATNWERLCCDLPSIVVTIANNQREVAFALNRRGLIHWIGDGWTVSTDQIQSSLADFEQINLRFRQALRTAKKIDGNGTQRVATFILGG